MVGALIKVPVSMLRITWNVCESLFVTLLRLPGALANLFLITFDFLRGRWVMRGSVLRCPEGHEVPIEGVYTCTACSYTWRGSVWRCGNVECRAHTPFVDCPDCGLSCRNPYRWGR